MHTCGALGNQGTQTSAIATHKLKGELGHAIVYHLLWL
jgi:HPt (histidine-containing phosphotransfer) domain-containing protein